MGFIVPLVSLVLCGAVDSVQLDLFEKYDVIMPRQRFRKAVTADSTKIWPNATVPYKFNAKLPGSLQQLLRDGMDHWENHTCIRFREKTRRDRDFVYYTSESCGCCSSIGRVGGRQTLSLKDYCANGGIAIHELGHAIGFWHEHTRPDRDSIIKVLWTHIYQKHHVNFRKRHPIEIQSFRRPYDLSSIMHYSPRTFSNGKGDTMVAYGGKKIGRQARSLSPEDILQARLLYGCPEPACEFDLEGDGEISSPYYPNPYTAELDCQWIIHVPSGKYSTLKFITFTLQDSYKCSADYMEIREYNKTGRLVGKLCGSGLPPPISSTVSLWLSFHSNMFLEKRGFLIRYASTDIKPVDQFQFNSDSRYSAMLSNADCVRLSTSSHGMFRSVDIPYNGRLDKTIRCSFIIDGSGFPVLFRRGGNLQS